MAASAARGHDTVAALTGVWTTYDGITVDVDTDGYFAGAAGTVTFPANGLFVTWAWTGLDVSSSSGRAGRMLANGDSVTECGPVEWHEVNAGNTARGTFGLFARTERGGDYLEMQARQDAGSTQDCLGSFSVVRLPTSVAYSVNRVSGDALTANDWFDLPIGTTAFISGVWNPTSGEITVPAAGNYLILADVAVVRSVSPADATAVTVDVRVNGSSLTAQAENDYRSGHFWTLRYLDAGDTITWRARVNDTDFTLTGSGLTVVLIDGPCANVTHSTSQTISNGSFTTLAFDTEYVDTDAFHDNSTNNSRLTVPTGLGGTYLVTGKITIATSVDAQLLLSVNGVTQVIWYVTQRDYTAAVVGVLELSDEDYVELKAESDSGGDGTEPEFALIRLDDFSFGDVALARIPKCPYLTYWAGWIAKILRYV